MMCRRRPSAQPIASALVLPQVAIGSALGRVDATTITHRPSVLSQQRGIMTRTALFIMLLCGAVAGCGDDLSSGTNNGSDNGSGNGDLGSEPAAGPANEIEAQIAGSDGSTTDLSGSPEDLIPETNQAAVALGTLTVFLSSGDGTLTTFAIDAPTDAIPGTVDITSDGATGTWLTIASVGGVYTSAAGSITVNQCPEVGDVITGTFDVSLNDFFGGTSTLTGSWRATVAVSDSSITCRVIEEEITDPGPGADVGSGGGNTCDLETCDGPCCPLVDDVVECVRECAAGPCNPLDPSFDMTGIECFECGVACDDIFLDDPECGGPYEAAVECGADAGCDEFEDEDEYSECLAEFCCDEERAAF